MSVASLYTPCFVMFCVFLYGPFRHGAHKLDLSKIFTTFPSLNISSIYIIVIQNYYVEINRPICAMFILVFY